MSDIRIKTLRSPEMALCQLSLQSEGSVDEMEVSQWQDAYSPLAHHCY